MLNREAETEVFATGDFASEDWGASLLASFARSGRSTTAPTTTTLRNHPSYRVKHAANRHAPHFIKLRDALPRTYSAKNAALQTKKARYSASPIAVACM